MFRINESRVAKRILPFTLILIAFTLICADPTSAAAQRRGSRKGKGRTSATPARRSDEAKQTNSMSPQAMAACRDALREMRKLMGATEIGVSYREYGTRLIDTKALVEEAFALIPDGEFKSEVALTMVAFIDANTAWNTIVNSTSRYGTTLSIEPEWMGLMFKYRIPRKDPDGNSWAYEDTTVLRTIWQAARNHLDRASSLLSQ